MKDSNKIKNIISISSVLISFAFIGYISFSKPLQAISASDLTVEQRESLALINNFRVENGVKKLSWDDRLASAALDKANDMVSKDYFDHVSPDGTKAWSFIDKEGYDYKFAGENLAKDYTNVEGAMVGWEDSPSHLRNLISDKFSDYGFAAVEENGSKLFVQLFGSDKLSYESILTNL